MKVIHSAQEKVLAILGKPKDSGSGWRLMKYCAHTPVEDGMLLHNLLTSELLLLTGEEYANLTGLDYLKAHWFVVPEGTNDKEYVDLVKWVLTKTTKQNKDITAYTILPTTDCNARCFYCFERGQARVSMSEETAHKTAQYIKSHCGGKPVGLLWFGGEPLFNWPIIDLISEELRQAGIPYTSRMISNGYLFDDDLVKKAGDLWNLKRIQITLDGTEAVYNRSKAYIYKEGSPYQIVLRNIERLLDANILVDIRLNLDIYNAQNLLLLVDELAERFSGREGLFLYADAIYDAERPVTDVYSDEKQEKRYNALQCIKEKISSYGFAFTAGIPKRLRLSRCMADSGHAIIIAPTGDIGLCDHVTDHDFIGHIDKEGFDAAMVKSWREQEPEIPECADCFYYPACIRLKKCTCGKSCFRQLREANLRDFQQSMRWEYHMWRTNTTVDSEEHGVFC